MPNPDLIPSAAVLAVSFRPAHIDPSFAIAPEPTKAVPRLEAPNAAPVASFAIHKADIAVN